MAPDPYRSDLVYNLVRYSRCAPCPSFQQACATGEKLKCTQHNPPQEVDPPPVQSYLTTAPSRYLPNLSAHYLPLPIYHYYYYLST